ncbi:MAG: hypothetical protein ACOVNY_13250 [Chitinophagaceae bacterium]|jgi:D-ribose pyranose/furanose isomerase RbsD
MKALLFMLNNTTVVFKKLRTPILALFLLTVACNTPKSNANNETTNHKNWKTVFEDKLPLLGHRNWILVVDKAFPVQNAAGIEYINSNENLLPTLEYVLNKVNNSSHVKPIIYQDKELGFITEEQSKGITKFIENSKVILSNQPVNTILHDSVFKKLDVESKLFKILVIKTNEIIPYTSVFMQLDCAYWNEEKERNLRTKIKN